jgi:hypothetical protein
MPGDAGCQGFACFFSYALILGKTNSYETNPNKCFNFLVKKMALF